MEHKWHVYIIETEKGKLYTGITTCPNRRFDEHLATFKREGKKGAKYFRTDCPLRIVYREGFENRSTASRREAYIKSMSASQKQSLVRDNNTKIIEGKLGA